MNRETLLSQLQWRYAVKRFDANKKVSLADWNVLEESLRLAPSSYGLQPWKFIIVQNPELRTQLKAVSWNQTQVTDCSHFVVLTYKKQMDEAHVEKYIQQTAKIRNVAAATMTDYKNMMIGDVVRGPRANVIGHWAQRQCYIAMGFLMEAAALLNIDCCPMEGLDPNAYDRLLGLENSGFATVAAVAVGYRHSDDQFQKLKKVRFDREDVIEIK